jgi:ribosomal subunit interface protein
MARAMRSTDRMELQVTFRDIPHSDALEDYVRVKAGKLGTFHRRITSCRVALESPHKHRSHGRPYRVRIDMKVPGAELVVAQGKHAEDAYAAVDEAFHDAERVLKSHASRQREITPIRAR